MAPDEGNCSTAIGEKRELVANRGNHSWLEIRRQDRLDRRGIREHLGMPRFDDLLDEDSARLIHGYILQRTRESVGGR